MGCCSRPQSVRRLYDSRSFSWTRSSRCASSGVIANLLLGPTTTRQPSFASETMARERVGGKPLARIRVVTNQHRWADETLFLFGTIIVQRRASVFVPSCKSAQNSGGARALSRMARQKSPVTGPMSVQPVEHRSTQAVQSPAVEPGRSIQGPARKKRATPQEVAQAATARISRRNSLRKQRRLLMK
jgi:hypothetical protein